MAKSSDNMSPNPKDQADQTSLQPTTSVAEETTTTTNLPDPPPPRAQAQAAADQGPPATVHEPPRDQPSSSRRRKSRQSGDHQDGDTAEKPKKRKETVFDAPEVPRPCAVCGKQFSNYKALFGHMRSHPGREWRGAFPPPISPPREEQLVEALLKIGQGILQSGEGGASASASASSSAATRRGLDIDLNKEPLSSPVDDGGPKLFDLNKEASGGSSNSDTG